MDNADMLPTRQGCLIFSLPEESNAFEMAIHGIDYACAWSELRERIRRALKYESDQYNGKQQEIFELIRSIMGSLEDEWRLPELD